MFDFFRKGASMTKKITGIAKMKGAPAVNPRPLRKITRVGTFHDGDKPVASLLLEVSSDDGSRSRGLMGRDSVPEIYGMLFEGLSGGGNFWMKDCLVPIDVAFMKKDGTVTKTYSMPVDKDGKDRYPYDDDDTMAVEVAGGLLEKLGIGDGAVLKTRELSKETDNG